MHRVSAYVPKHGGVIRSCAEGPGPPAVQAARHELPHLLLCKDARLVHLARIVPTRAWITVTHGTARRLTEHCASPHYFTSLGRPQTSLWEVQAVLKHAVN